MLIRFALFSLFAISSFAQGTRSDYERANSVRTRADGSFARSRVEPQWNGDSFWYRVATARDRHEFVFVDCAKGTRAHAFDHAKLAAALFESTRKELDPAQLALEKLVVNPEENWVRFRFDRKRWHFARDTGILRELPEDVAAEPVPIDRKPRPSKALDGATDTHIVFTNKTSGDAQLYWLDEGAARHPYAKLKPGETFKQHTFVGHVWLAETPGGVVLGVYEGQADEAKIELVESPPEKAPAEKPPGDTAPKPEWKPFTRDFNVWAKHRDSGEEVQLSRDGSKDDAYSGPMQVSPDGTRLVVLRVKPEQEHAVYFVESSPKDQLQPKLHQHQYLKPGDRIRQERPRLFDLAKRTAITLDDALFAKPWDISDLRWAADSSRFTFLYNERGHQVLRIVNVTADGVASTLVEDTSATFIDYSQKHWHQWRDASNELLWSSERDGWNHIFRFDAQTGALKNQITRGTWNVRNVERVEDGKLLLKVTGVNSGQDPYYLHWARVNFDGTAFTLLTGGDGTRSEKSPVISPNGKWLVDTFSRTDMPPVTELRSAETGALVCELERANAGEPVNIERFTAKGRDGKTDIYGIIIRPSNFDPTKTYPVIEEIYAGPHGAFVPKAWGRLTRQRSIAELGFILVQIDGMGTNFRGKAFQDVAWRNLKDAGFPDRIAWMKSAAETRPWMDLSRVGIYGGSAGGQNALAGLLHHGDFYKAGVADCGCHDNRMDKIWWNEAWLGEVGPWYGENSNVTHAAKLTGKLLLIVGEVDTNVDPASTMQVANALVKADKDFELLVMPSTNHGSAETPYASRRRMDFFVRTLYGAEPRRP